MIGLLFHFAVAFAQDETHHHARHDTFAFSCSQDERLNLAHGACDPLPVAVSERVMVHGNAFLVGIRQDGPRGRDGLAAPTMLMLNAGKTYGRHFLDVGVMLTAEKWTFPRAGYPQIAQEGEENERGEPYRDAQHPHSSPLMGLTFTDTLRLGEDTNLALSFAPRGQATEGPIAFMHRPTGMVNPDTPLGHHVGQDVGHITSTVLAGALSYRRLILEASAFHGREPHPDKVDLPLGALDSGAVRVGWRWNENTLLLASYAIAHDPEGHAHGGAETPNEYRRHSFSIYNKLPTISGWDWQNALVYGRVQNYDGTPNLTSFLEEATFARGAALIWGRYEYLERVLAGERGWVNAATLGYTHRVYETSALRFGVGASATKYVMPADFHASYGGDPWAIKVFVQASGMRMF